MKLAVVIPTYNSPEALRKTLLGFVAQTRPADELIVADDGSEAGTAAVLAKPPIDRLPVQHVWHPDEGWTKPVILNVAIAHLSSDYVVFCDGDSVPRADFLACHERMSRPGCYASGTRVHLPESVHRNLSDRDILSGRMFDYDFLYERWGGVQRFRRRLAAGRWEGLLNLLTWRYGVFHGCNASAWRKDLLRVNGFNESFGYGYEDRELGARLNNAGCRSRWLKYSLCQSHLDHPASGVGRSQIEANRRRFHKVRFSRTTRTEPGIDTALYRWQQRLSAAANRAA